MSTQQNSTNVGILATAKDWTKASQAELAWNKSDPVPIAKAKFDKLCHCKHIREKEEQKWCEVEEAEKCQVEVEEAKRQVEVEAWVKAAEEVEHKRKEAEAQKKCQQADWQQEKHALNVVQHSTGQQAQWQFESLQDFMGEMAAFGYKPGEWSTSGSSSELGENEAEEVAEEIAALYKEQAEAERAKEKRETEGVEGQEKEVESQGEDKGKGKQKAD
ncbi:hypothetical protein ID866_11791 [Astraeus odoratus]|nr:hypothetical protein ID866_11791 [Astraeus odoratus]